MMTVMASACSGFLEEHNPVGLNSIYDTEDVLEASVYGVQYAFNGGYGFTGWPVESFGIASGLLHWGITGGSPLTNPQYESGLHFTQYSAGTVNGNYFQTMYVAVSRANSLLAALPDSPVRDDFKLEIEAETRYLRAVAYFWIVRIWGDCPLRVKPDDAESATNCPRAPYYEVYKFIVDELKFAEANMRTPERVRECSPHIPRSNRYAATAFLAQVYLTVGSLLSSPDDNYWDSSKEGRSPDFSGIGLSKDDLTLAANQAYTKALEYAEKLIPESASHDPGCPYRLLTKFGDLFAFNSDFSRDGYTAWMNPEQILSLSSTVSASLSGGYTKVTLPQYPEGTSCTVSNSYYGRMRPTRWMFQKWCSTYPGTVLAANPSVYATSSDPRLDVTFYYGQMTYSNGSGTVVLYPRNYSNFSRVYVAPFFKKAASKNYNANITDADVYMMRFAEMYFVAAEAAAYLGDEATARKYIEVIHARARHSVPDGSPDSLQPSWEGRTFATKEDLLDAIFWEWVFEFAGENLEYFETHRHGARWLIRNICIPRNAFMAQPENKGLLGTYYAEGWKYPEDITSDPDEVGSDVFMIRKGLLTAFPQNECLYNAAISEVDDQNDYTW